MLSKQTKNVRSGLILWFGLVTVVLVSGCGVGAGSRVNEVDLKVTQQFGHQPVGKNYFEKVASSETVMRYLQRHHKVTTRYGGNFVQEIDGLEGDESNRFAWFFYVNGIESSIGAAEAKIHPGDRIWWDYRSWKVANGISAVVGSFPEPFLGGIDGKRLPIRVDCAKNAQEACEKVSKQLEEAGISVSKAVLGAASGKEVLRVIVGEWSIVNADAAVHKIELGPQASGVFVKFGPEADSVSLLKQDGTVASTYGEGTGLIAATRFGEQVPTWVVTGIGKDGVLTAADALTEKQLQNKFAALVTKQQVLAAPSADVGSLKYPKP